ncbi:MAG TPA: phosphotransferase [Dehalococcoidia bacterium]|nr:phosphotransferase [Dehalococcoidia bacterium]
MVNVPEPARELLSARLPAAVRDALGEPTAALGTWDVVPLKGSLATLTSARSVFRVRGTARTGSTTRPWSLVLKVLAPTPSQDDPARADYWRREQALYGKDVLTALPAGLRAPRCYRCDDLNGVVWLWLEPVHDSSERPWNLARWAGVARQLGQFNGAYLAGWPLPQAPSLGGRRLRTWLERHRPLVARIAAAPDNPAVRRWWPRSVVTGLLQLWEERNVFCDALERLPQTFCHGDAIPRNLLTRRATDGSAETVAIDWEYAGCYAAGEEIGQSLSVAAAFFDVEPADLPMLDETLLINYLQGLRDAGWRGNTLHVQFAYKAHAALRNAFNAVGTTVPNSAAQAAARHVYGRSWEELAERRAAVRPFLLECAASARRCLQSL